MSGNSMMQALERVDEGELFEYRMNDSSSKFISAIRSLVGLH